MAALSPWTVTRSTRPPPREESDQSAVFFGLQHAPHRRLGNLFALDVLRSPTLALRASGVKLMDVRRLDDPGMDDVDRDPMGPEKVGRSFCEMAQRRVAHAAQRHGAPARHPADVDDAAEPGPTHVRDHRPYGSKISNDFGVYVFQQGLIVGGLDVIADEGDVTLTQRWRFE